MDAPDVARAGRVVRGAPYSLFLPAFLAAAHLFRATSAMRARAAGLNRGFPDVPWSVAAFGAAGLPRVAAHRARCAAAIRALAAGDIVRLTTLAVLALAITGGVLSPMLLPLLSAPIGSQSPIKVSQAPHQLLPLLRIRYLDTAR